MSKSINGAMLALVGFLVAYCVCFWFGVMPKFYPLLGRVSFSDPPGGPHIAVKFAGAAVVGLAVGLVGFVVGRLLPAKCSWALHAAAWLVGVAACVYLVGREVGEYLL